MNDSKNVLIIEDDKEMAKMLLEFLDNNGYKTTLFYSPDNVITKIKILILLSRI